MIAPGFSLIVLAAIVYAVVAASRRFGARAGQADSAGPAGGGDGTGRAEHAGSTVHPGGYRAAPRDLRERVGQFFRLGLLLAAVVLVAEGIGSLISEALPRSGTVVRNADTVARALAFTVVGVPVLAGLSRWTAQRLRAGSDEVRSGGWALYVNLTASLSLVVAMVAVDTALAWAVAGESFDPDAVGRAVAWGAVWALHWRLAAHRARAVPAQLHANVLVGSALGLAAAAFGTGRLLATAGRTLYDAAFFDAMVGGGTAPLRRAAVAAAVGWATWAWHWLRHGVRAPRTNSWNGFVLGAGVGGGLAAAVVGGAQVLHGLLQWSFGNPHADRAAAHFAGTPGSLAAVSVGLAAWWYHRHLLGPGSRRARTDVDRTYQYVAGGVGLVTVAIGTTVAVAALGEAIGTRDVLAGTTSVANTVVFAVTMIAVGGPVWGWFWQRGQRHAAASPAVECASLPRRVYLALVFGASAAVGLVSLVVLLVLAFQDIARSRAGNETIYHVRIAAGLVVTTGAIAGYHALVYRADRAALPPALPGRAASAGVGAVPASPTVGLVAAREVIVVADQGEAARDAIATALGARVRVWQPLLRPTPLPQPQLQAVGPPAGTTEAAMPPPLDPVELVEAVRAAAAERVLVFVQPDGSVQVVPFREL